MSRINELEGQVKAFAEACYDTNSISELEEALNLEEADATDCQEWRVTPEEWRQAIQAALADRKAD